METAKLASVKRECASQNVALHKIVQAALMTADAGVATIAVLVQVPVFEEASASMGSVLMNSVKRTAIVKKGGSVVVSSVSCPHLVNPMMRVRLLSAVSMEIARSYRDVAGMETALRMRSVSVVVAPL